MMVEYVTEDLYLAKDSTDSKKDIYVKNCPLIQHQLDGIRFLYRAFKKKEHGVILNDPSGYGKRVQTALFLSAILPTLSKPVLVLCTEGKELLWMNYFQEWTQVSDDVAIELTNPLVKTKVLISPSHCACAFARRDWSLLIVDHSLTKDILKAKLRADLNIWITSSNIKEDLSLYSSFRQWIYPNDKFNADKYKAHASSALNLSLMKKAMLDACLEHTVLRRWGVTPFTKNQVAINNGETITTKKNKDATGTKIKRTKRKSENNDTQTEDKPRKINKTTRKTIEENTEDFKIGDLYVENQKNSGLHASEINSRVLRLDSDTDSDNREDLVMNKQSENNLESVTIEETTEAHKKIDFNDSEIAKKEDKIRTVDDKNDETTEAHKEKALDNAEITKNEDNTRTADDNNDAANDELVENDCKLSEDLFSTDFTTSRNEIETKVKTTEDVLKDKEIVLVCNKEPELGVQKTDQNKPDDTNLSSFELKLKQLEELTLKKFKGSFLDSLI